MATTHTPFEGGLDLLPRFQIKRSASEWLVSNALTELFWDRARGRVRYMVLRYEDFVHEPKKSVRSICDLLGEREEPFFFLDDESVWLGDTTHQVWGNPSRFSKSVVKIRADDELPARSHPGTSD